MIDGMSRRRVAAPVALLAALAIAAGGGSSPWAVSPTQPGEAAVLGAAPTAMPAVHLEHLELVALRAQSNASSPRPRFDPRVQTVAAQVAVAAGVAAASRFAPPPPPPAPKPKPPSPKQAAPNPYVGSNHVWIPALHISRSVRLFPCSRTRPPDNFVYRWGCAGRNNVYLLGHAWGVFKPLHDAYLAGRLHVGMRAIYADGAGRIHVYKVTTWRVVKPTDSEWAIASQRVPSMTLQTCVGTLRLNVRLVEVAS